MIKKYKKILLWGITLVLVLSACGRLQPDTDKKEEKPQEYTNSPTEARDDEKADETLPNNSEIENSTNALQSIEQMIDEMTLEQKVGQLFIVAFRKNHQGKNILVLEESIKQQIKKYKPGGIILFAENIDTTNQTQQLIADMQKSSDIPLFIAVDEEGGIVSRLNSSPNMGATKLPGNSVLGQTQDTALAYEVGQLIGNELACLGFNMNFAPVADVNTNPNNPVIGRRAFGDDPYKVGEMVEAVVKGLQDSNISAVLKHFPGHGDTSFDTHKQAVSVEHDKKRLEEVEFVPFQKGIAAGADGVMTAHIQVPNITDTLIPATLSYEVLTGILREELNYPHLIITDALEMAAISNYWTPAQAAVQAFKAGADILLMPASFEQAYHGVLEAVRSGEISEQRLDESIKRILYIKQKRNITAEPIKHLDAEKILGSEAHQQIVKRILEKAAQQKER